MAAGDLPNAGEPGRPRILRADVAVKPGHRRDGSGSRTALLDRSVRLHRESSTT